MAANTVRIEFIGDDARLKRTMAGIRRDSDRTASSMKRTLGGIGKTALAVGAGLAGMGAVAAVGIGAAINKAATFDKTMRQIAVATDAPKEQLQELTDLAIEMGKETVFSAQDAGQAMLELSKGGLSAATIQAGAMKATMLLAAAGNLEMANAATYMSNALNTFNLKGKQAKRVAVALAGGANASTASVESLGMALSQVGPGATNAGLSIEETVAALALFDNAGIKGSDAGTSLKTMLARLVPQTDKAQKAADALGLSFTDAHGNFVDLETMAARLQKAFSGLTQEQRATRLQIMFGSDATRAATVLTKEGAAGVAKMIAATKDQAKAQEMANSGMEGAAGAIEAFKGSWETVQIMFATRLLPKFTKVTNWLAEKLPEALDTIGPKLEEFGVWWSEKVQPKVESFGRYMKNKLIPALTHMSEDVLPVFADSLSSIVGDITDVTDAFDDLTESSDTTNDSVGTLGWTLKLIAKVAAEAVKQITAPLVVFLQTLKKIKETMQWIMGKVDKLGGSGLSKLGMPEWLRPDRKERAEGRKPTGDAFGGGILTSPRGSSPARGPIMHIETLNVNGSDARAAVASLPNRLEQAAWRHGMAVA